MTQNTSTISDAILEALKPLTMAQTGANDARDLARVEGDKALSARLQVMLDVANVSLTKNWPEKDLDKACKHAAAQLRAYQSNTDAGDKANKTTAQFVSHLRNVVDPKVRGKFPALLKVCQDAWHAEEQAIAVEIAAGGKASDVETPLKLWRNRLTHVVCAVLPLVRKGQAFDTVEQLVAHAIDNDPRMNAKIIANKLENMRNVLSEMYKNFGHNDIKDVMDHLADITADDLAMTRKRMLAAMPQVNNEEEASEEDDSDIEIDEPVPTNITPIPTAFAKLAEHPLAFEPAVDAAVSLDELDGLAA